MERVEGSFRKPEMHARLLAAVMPDVVMLDEVYEQVTADSLRRFFDLPALRALGPWQFVLGGSGGRQRTVVAARRRAVRPVESMAAMRYIDSSLDSLRRITPPAGHRLIDIEEAAQISVSALGWMCMAPRRCSSHWICRVGIRRQCARQSAGAAGRGHSSIHSRGDRAASAIFHWWLAVTSMRWAAFGPCGR